MSPIEAKVKYQSHKLSRKSTVWMSDKKDRKFPSNFLFGVATSAYQVEGSWNVEDKGLNIWDWLCHNKSHLIADRSSGDDACDSYNQYKRDVEMLTELGVDYYRFSLSWTRILPTGFTDKISQVGIDYYNNLINELLKNNIQPLVTLHHWDLPHNFQKIGGWANPLIADYFVDFARIAFENFGDRVKMWVTMNEPFIFGTLGHGENQLAPALKLDGIADYLCGHTMLLGHAKVYHLYDSTYRKTQNGIIHFGHAYRLLGRIGITMYSCWNQPASSSSKDIEAAEISQQFELNGFIIYDSILCPLSALAITLMTSTFSVAYLNKKLGWFAHPIYSKEGDYPKIMKEMVAKKSAEQGFQRSRLPTFTPEEVAFVRGASDFFGLNHYTTQLVSAKKDLEFPVPSYAGDVGVSAYVDSNWSGGNMAYMKTVPWGFRKLLNWINTAYDNPEVMILENGYSDDGKVNDEERVLFYREYFNSVLDAIEDGCNVSTFVAWSLMDNFEWCCGYSKHFGLYQVNNKDPKKKRIPKESSFYFRHVIESRKID
ncbi:myrosinase 1-like [Arctopsyche grandis]|uniref:myrosinase 1-like n=1 Tax=Arctopsyche grandis TaxID=121162 RepID=UPI00406D7178